MRLIDWPASTVCSVLSTRWPVSAAMSATSTVGAIAHFTDENHLRRLAQRGAQAVRIIVEIVAELALVEGRASRRVNEFDRILERDDVDGLASR